MRYIDFMIASISAHSTIITSTILHAYHYNLLLCRCHVQATVQQRNSYCIHDIHVTEAISSCTPISHAPLIYGILFTHADILIFSCARSSQLFKKVMFLYSLYVGLYRTVIIIKPVNQSAFLKKYNQPNTILQPCSLSLYRS